MASEVSPAFAELGFIEFTADNLEDQLPKIICAISEGASNPNLLQLLNVLFTHLAPQLDVDILDFKLLQYVLPPTRNLFEKCLVEIGELLTQSDSLDEKTAIDISQSLQACLDVLSGYGELLDVISKESVEADKVRSLNDNLPPILIEAFNHCKDSESSYGVYFEESTVVLSAFFKKSYEIQTKYYKALEDKITFSSSFDDDFTCLAKVLDYVLEITEIVVSLDVKTCVDQWKLYGRLYSKHVTNLQNLVDLSRPIALLVSNVRLVVGELTSNQETSEKHGTKLLKVGNFLLKMIVKLCELSECRFREGMKDLAELLLLLHSCTKTYDLEDDMKEEIRRFIGVGCSPLLVLLLKEEDFFKAFINIKHHHLELTGRVGLLFLTLSIMKNVVDGKAPPFWNDQPLIELVVEQFELCGPMIDMNSHFEGKDSYSSMISICSAFMIATVDESSFAKLENFLISKLFSGKLHSSIFISDYLCLMSRMTSDGYCFDLTTYLCEALKNWPQSCRYRPEYNIVENLVGRLFRLLSQKSRELLVMDYQNNEESDQVCRWLGGNVVARTLLEKYDHFCRQPSLSSFNSLTNCHPMDIEFEVDPSDYDFISQLFVSVKDAITFINSRRANHELWDFKFLQYSMKILGFLVLTQTKDMADEVVAKLANLVDDSLDDVKLLVVAFLTKSSLILGKADRSSVSSLLINLMESTDELVASLSLNLCKSVEIQDLKDFISPNHQLALRYSSVTDVDRTASSSTFFSVFNSRPESAHRCSKRVTTLDDATLDIPPAKKIKTDDSNDLHVLNVLRNIQNETSILKTTTQHSFSHQATTILDTVIKELTAILTKASNNPE